MPILHQRLTLWQQQQQLALVPRIFTCLFLIIIFASTLTLLILHLTLSFDNQSIWLPVVSNPSFLVYVHNLFLAAVSLYSLWNASITGTKAGAMCAVLVSVWSVVSILYDVSYLASSFKPTPAPPSDNSDAFCNKQQATCGITRTLSSLSVIQLVLHLLLLVYNAYHLHMLKRNVMTYLVRQRLTTRTYVPERIRAYDVFICTILATVGYGCVTLFSLKFGVDSSYAYQFEMGDLIYTDQFSLISLQLLISLGVACYSLHTNTSPTIATLSMFLSGLTSAHFLSFFFSSLQMEYSGGLSAFIQAGNFYYWAIIWAAVNLSTSKCMLVGIGLSCFSLLALSIGEWKRLSRKGRRDGVNGPPLYNYPTITTLFFLHLIIMVIWLLLCIIMQWLNSTETPALIVMMRFFGIQTMVIMMIYPAAYYSYYSQSFASHLSSVTITLIVLLAQPTLTLPWLSQTIPYLTSYWLVGYTASRACSSLYTYSGITNEVTEAVIVSGTICNLISLLIVSVVLFTQVRDTYRIARGYSTKSESATENEGGTNPNPTEGTLAAPLLDGNQTEESNNVSLSVALDGPIELTRGLSSASDASELNMLQNLPIPSLPVPPSEPRPLPPPTPAPYFGTLSFLCRFMLILSFLIVLFYFVHSISSLILLGSFTSFLSFTYSPIIPADGTIPSLDPCVSPVLQYVYTAAPATTLTLCLSLYVILISLLSPPSLALRVFSSFALLISGGLSILSASYLQRTFNSTFWVSQSEQWINGPQLVASGSLIAMSAVMILLGVVSIFSIREESRKEQDKEEEGLVIDGEIQLSAGNVPSSFSYPSAFNSPYNLSRSSSDSSIANFAPPSPPPVPSHLGEIPCSRCTFVNPSTHRFCGACGSRLSRGEFSRDGFNELPNEEKERIGESGEEEVEGKVKGSDQIPIKLDNGVGIHIGSPNVSQLSAHDNILNNYRSNDMHPPSPDSESVGSSGENPVPPERSNTG